MNLLKYNTKTARMLLHLFGGLFVASCVLVYAPMKTTVPTVVEERIEMPQPAPPPPPSEKKMTKKLPTDSHPMVLPKPAPLPPESAVITKIVEVPKDDTLMNFTVSALAGVASTFITKLIEYLFRRRKDAQNP